MSTDLLSLAARLSDQELLARTQVLAQQERGATSALIAHLAVLDERRLFLAEGYSSLFAYCTQALRLSESAAYRRIEAARAARKYPVILEMLSDGSVNLTTVVLLAPELTPANRRGLLEAARHKSKRQVEELVARLRPQAPVPSTIRKMPTASLAPASAEAPAPEPTPPPALSPPRTTPSGAPPAVVIPLAPERYKVQFTASAETHAKLRLAQDLLRHQIPDGDLGEIMDRALTALLLDLAKQKVAATDRPRENKDRENHDRATHGPVPGSCRISRHIPAEVRRTVWLRDSGRCAFVAHNGRRCSGRAFLEFHHVVPYSVGGEATIDNIELRCRAHNGYEADLYFGQRAGASTGQISSLKGAGMMASTRLGPSGDTPARPP